MRLHKLLAEENNIFQRTNALKEAAQKKKMDMELLKLLDCDSSKNCWRKLWTEAILILQGE